MKLEEISGAKINSHGVDSYTHMQLYKITGTPHQISKAENLVKEFRQEMDSMKEEEICVPEQKVGLVIGTGGATIKKIQSTSGASVKNLYPRSETPTTGRFVIPGSQNQIDQARSMIKDAACLHLKRSSHQKQGSHDDPFPTKDALKVDR